MDDFTENSSGVLFWSVSTERQYAASLARILCAFRKYCSIAKRNFGSKIEFPSEFIIEELKELPEK